VIRHQAICGNADPSLGLGLRQNSLKGGVVRGLLKQREPSDSAVQDVIDEIFSSKARTARHGNLLPDLKRSCQ